MDWTRVQREWNLFRSRVKQKWGKLEDRDLEVIKGRRDRLEVKIRQRYGFSRDHIRKEVDDWLRWQHMKSQGSHTMPLVSKRD